MKQIILFTFLIIGAVACSPSNRIPTQEKPPGFFGKLIQNTTSRYNAYYNANFIYEQNIIAGKSGFQENYDSLFPPSIQDALAEKGSVAGEMDIIIKKTTQMIEKKPYSKWVDDHFLLNGIAHYIQGDYFMAEKIFRYTSTEYKNGVQFDRVNARQKKKGIDLEKQRKEEAKEKLKELEAQQKEIEQARKEGRKIRKEKAEKIKKTRKVLSKKEQFKAKQKAKKEGRDSSTEKIVQEIKEANRIIERKGKSLTEEERELLSTAPVLQNNQGIKESQIGHHLAAKDAMLWLAKTYITTEEFIKANAILTAINEDEYFPKRLNTNYYLTYADMHIRLDNLPKAIEYVQLATETASSKEKGRLYYLLGQLYSETNQWSLAKEAFNLVEKYHPYYDMIYHAKMKNISHAFATGQFQEVDYVTPLKKMAKDVKNEEFLDEVYYYLGNAYAAQNNQEEAILAYEKALETETSNHKHAKNVHLALAQHYYSLKEFGEAQHAYSEAAALYTTDDVAKQTNELKATILSQIDTHLKNIQLQDSLLQLASMSTEEQLDFVTKKVNKELRKQFRDKLNQVNRQYGNNSTVTPNRSRRRASKNTSDAGFYFYDVQQSINGFSEFKQIWGNRANVDNWRRSAIADRASTLTATNTNNLPTQNTLSKENLIQDYLANIPQTEQEINTAVLNIQNDYLSIGKLFTYDLGDEENAEFYLKEFIETRKPTLKQQEEAQQILLVAYDMAGNNQFANQIKQTDQGKKAIENSKQRPSTKVNEVADLYARTYAAYTAEKYEEVLKLVNQSEKFQNNEFEDKFAFIKAMSKGALEGEATLKLELQKFSTVYVDSPLKMKALKIIK